MRTTLYFITFQFFSAVIQLSQYLGKVARLAFAL
jgi:hypothetical protein